MYIIQFFLEKIICAMRGLAHCKFEELLRNFLLSKYLGASKWKNEVMVIKNTPNENDWPRAILEICQKK